MKAFARAKKYYSTPDGTTCPECGEECEIIPLENSFDYAGTHCTHGVGGVHYPSDYGAPVSSCCEAYIDWATEEEEDFSWYETERM